MTRTLVILLVVSATLGFVQTAHAVPVVANYNLDFSSPTENFWGPGKSAASFSYDQLILGNTTLGMRFQTGASLGTVSSNYNGAISVAYDNQVQQGMVNLNLGFQGDTSGGHFATAFGAFAKVTAYFPVIGGVTVTNPDYSLHTTSTYTPSPPDAPADSDSFTPASSAIGPDLPGGTAQAGIDYDIVQNSTHTINAVGGKIVATHEGGAEQRSAFFSLAAMDTVSLDLDLPGSWDVQLMDLSVDNVFSTTLSLAFVPFVQYILGVNCGDPATDADNNADFPFFGCIGDGRLDSTVASFVFARNNPFALDMRTNQLASFQIEVTAAPAPTVPEPATLALLGAAVGGIAFFRRRKLC